MRFVLVRPLPWGVSRHLAEVLRVPERVIHFSSSPSEPNVWTSGLDSALSSPVHFEKGPCGEVGVGTLWWGGHLSSNLNLTL